MCLYNGRDFAAKKGKKMITKVEFNKLNETKKPSLAKDSEVRYRGKKLTKQQIAILENLGVGYTNPEIAQILEISPRTVESHLQGIRKLVSSEISYRLGDRELVLFARDMLDGYEVFVNLQEELEKKKAGNQIIEDWDDDDEDPIELPPGHKSFNGEPVPQAEPRRYLKKQSIFNIEEFKVESKDVVYKNGIYLVT